MFGRNLVRVGLLLSVVLAASAPVSATSAPLSGSTTAFGNLNEGLIAYWPMEEAATNPRVDATDNDLDLTDTGGVAQAPGKIGLSAGLTITGSAYLSHVDDPDLDPGNGDFTIATWVYLESKPPSIWGQDSATIVNKWGSSDRREYNLVYRSYTNEKYGTLADTFEFAASSDGTDPAGSARAVSTNAQPIQTGQWYFLVAWHDTVSQTLNLQVNNGTPNSITYTTGITDTNSLFEIGRNEGNLTPGGSPLRLNGRIDELGLWNRTLTPLERTLLYNNGNGTTYPFVPPVYLPLALGQPAPVYTVLKQEDFEGLFPNTWQRVDQGPAAGQFFWGQRNCTANNGSFSGWAIGAGANGSSLICGANYPDSHESWMIYGPVNLTDALTAELQYAENVNSQSGFDELCALASANGTNFFGQCASGNSAGWITAVLDLGAVTGLGDLRGDGSVWIAFVFGSNASGNLANGAFVDDILLRKCTGGACPSISADQQVASLTQRAAQFTR